MTLDRDALLRFANNLRDRGKQPATIESYCRDAKRFLEFLAENAIGAEQVEPDTLLAFQTYLRADCTEQENSVRRTAIGVRQFFRFLSEARMIGPTPFDGVPIPERFDTPAPQLDRADVESLTTLATEGQPIAKGRRDAAIVALLAYEGVKATELIALKWRDFLSDGDQGATLRVGGSRSRVLRLDPFTANAIRAYREAFDAEIKAAFAQASELAMFIAFKGREKMNLMPKMSRHGLKFIIYELGARADLPHLNTETLRHFAVARLLASGRTVEDVMQHLGLRRMGNIAKHIGGEVEV